MASGGHNATRASTSFPQYSLPIPSQLASQSRTSHSADRFKSRSPPISPLGYTGEDIRPLTPNTTSSVKHLTCYWWKNTGYCRFKEEECLYSHHDTGKYAHAPRQVVPGQPAMAGKRLEHATRNIVAHKSSSSLPSLARQSRPNTPSFDLSFASSSSPLAPTTPTRDFERLENENRFLRDMIEQNTREKNVMISTIEGLQKDKSDLQKQLQDLRGVPPQQLQNPSLSNPFGVIGQNRLSGGPRGLGIN